MDGLIFFFSAWLCWVYLTFLAGRNDLCNKRMAAVVLLSIIVSPLHVELWGMKIYGGSVCFFLYSLWFLWESNFKKTLYVYMLAMVISAVYSSIRFFELFDPVIFVVNRLWFVSAMIAIIAVILQHSVKWRLILVSIGTFQGELLITLVLKEKFFLDIGGFAYLDTLSLSAGIIVFWSFLENIKTWLNTSMGNFERNKKSSP